MSAIAQPALSAVDSARTEDRYSDLRVSTYDNLGVGRSCEVAIVRADAAANHELSLVLDGNEVRDVSVFKHGEGELVRTEAVLTFASPDGLRMLVSLVNDALRAAERAGLLAPIPET